MTPKDTPHKIEFDELLEEFKEANYEFYEKDRGNISSVPDAVLKERADRFDEAREELYDLIEKALDLGKIKVLLEEGDPVEFSEANWFYNGDVLNGVGPDGRVQAAKLSKAKRIEFIET